MIGSQGTKERTSEAWLSCPGSSDFRHCERGRLLRATVLCTSACFFAANILMLWNKLLPSLRIRQLLTAGRIPSAFPSRIITSTLSKTRHRCRASTSHYLRNQLIRPSVSICDRHFVPVPTSYLGSVECVVQPQWERGCCVMSVYTTRYRIQKCTWGSGGVPPPPAKMIGHWSLIQYFLGKPQIYQPQISRELRCFNSLHCSKGSSRIKAKPYLFS